MNSAKLNDWMQVIGIFAVVASLIFVGLQMRQDRVLANVESLSSRSGTIAELANLISDNKALWVSGLNGDELPEEDQAVFQAMVEAVESYYVALWIRLRSIGRNDGRSNAAEEAVDNYAFAIYSHIGLRRAWRAQLVFWRARDSAFDIDDAGGDFRILVDASLQQLDKDAPVLPAEKRYVFW